MKHVARRSGTTTRRAFPKQAAAAGLAAPLPPGDSEENHNGLGLPGLEA